MCSNLDKLEEMQGVRGLELLSRKRVVLSQVFATKPETIIIHLFQGIGQN